jgi:hydroxyacylglutathione hydrolase
MQIEKIVVGELKTNCYLLISNGELAIVDPGGSAEKILSKIKETKVKSKYIINSHSHPDHTLANEKMKKETGAEILTKLKEGDEIKIGQETLKVISTPGHTKDSICLLDNNFILTGDTLFKEGYGRTDLPGGSEKEMKKSLERLSEIIKPGMVVYPGHSEILIIA